MSAEQSNEPSVAESVTAQETPAAHPLVEFLVGLWQSAFTPGTNSQLVIAMNASFAALFMSLAFLLFASNFNGHVIALSFVALGLFLSVQWFITELNNARAQDETDKKQEDEEAADTEDAAEYVVVEDAVSTGVSLHTTEQQLTMRQAAIADAAGRSEIIEALERIDLIERPEEILASKEDADGKIEKVYLDQAASTDNTKPVDTMKAEEKETNEAIITSNTTQTICKVVETSQMPDTSVHTETTTREINVVKVSEEQEVAISSDVAEDVAKMLQTERPVVTEEVTVEEITLASGTTITNTTTKVKAIIKGAMVETTTVETKTVSDEEQVVPMLATVEETATSVPDTAPGQNETSDDDSWSAVEREEIQDAPETVSTEATNVATTTSIAPDTDESAKSTA